MIRIPIGAALGQIALVGVILQDQKDVNKDNKDLRKDRKDLRQDRRGH